MNFFDQYHIFIIGFLFLSILIGMTFFTWKEKQWVKKKYNKKDIIALGFGIICFGLSSDQEALKKYKGFLVVHKKGLMFKGRFSDIIFDIPVKSIKKVYHGDSHRETRLYQSAVKVDFLARPEINSETIDTIAFKVAYPAQWIKIVKKHLLHESIGDTV
ncbi:MAG: hypothetical protein PF690_05015 [Deltaproteobacteria bacterium]|jgi:hypothetical protein|nr:hypothetical protein [Deltaproteobacteria bacterium]